MRLVEYIEQVGDEHAAQLFRVKRRTAMSWRLGSRSPRPWKAQEIVEKTGGAVTMAEIYEPRQAA